MLGEVLFLKSLQALLEIYKIRISALHFALFYYKLFLKFASSVDVIVQTGFRLASSLAPLRVRNQPNPRHAAQTPCSSQLVWFAEFKPN